MNAASTVHPFRVSSHATLRQVFQTLEHAGTRLVVATNDAGQVEGIMTDGDARRALLAGALLDNPVSPLLVREFTSVQPFVSRAEVVELMHARYLYGVPIVDERGVLHGLHLLHDVLGIQRRPNWAVVMAGGRGTRLGPLTAHTPKPMIRVAGRPILERLLLHLVGFGIERIFLSVNYLSHVIEDHFGDGSRFGCRVDYLREERPLGTAGSLALLPERPVDPVLVINGDLVTQADVGSMLDFHRASSPAVTVAIRPYFHTVPFGCLELDGTRVVQFEEKPRITRVISAGMYVISPRVLDLVPHDEESTIPALVESCLARNEDVRAFEVQDDWIDVGQREHLDLARGGT